jgi:hypothetical protein
MIEFLLDPHLSLRDKAYGLFYPMIWKFKRIYCWAYGCRVVYWSENEYIYGKYCERCEASISSAEGHSPHQILSGNLLERRFDQ